MGIGLLAMLALFPIGALSMAQAIKDERAAQASINAGNVAAIWKSRTDPAVTAPPNAYANPGSPGLPDLDRRQILALHVLDQRQFAGRPVDVIWDRTEQDRIRGVSENYLRVSAPSEGRRAGQLERITFRPPT